MNSRISIIDSRVYLYKNWVKKWRMTEKGWNSLSFFILPMRKSIYNYSEYVCMYKNRVKNDRKISENLALLASQWGKKKFWAHSSKKIKNFHWENKEKYSCCSLPYFFRYSMRITFTFIKNHNGKVGFSSWYILVTYLLLDFVREIEKPKLKRYPDICSIYTRQLVPHVVLQDIESESLLRCCN